MKLEDLSVGQHVYVIQHWTNFVEETEVQGFEQDRNGETYAKLHCLETRGSIGRYPDDIYATEDIAMEARNKRENAIKDSYRITVHSPEDLANLCYNQAVCQSEEYTDWEAMAVAKEKAKEFGIDLGRQPEKIESVEDLVCYCYNNRVAWVEEYTDLDARKYAEEKASELGVDLDPDVRGKQGLGLTDADLKFAEQMTLSDYGL